MHKFIVNLGLNISWYWDWYLGFPKTHSVMDQSMLEEESDDTWMFSGLSGEERALWVRALADFTYLPLSDEEDGLSGISQLFHSF